MSKTDLLYSIENFDPNGPGVAGNLFGLPFTPETGSLIVIPVPWEVTVSYHSGAAYGPSAILEASTQVDLFMKDIPHAWKTGIAMLPVPESLIEESLNLRELAAEHIVRFGRNEPYLIGDPILVRINEACETLNIYIKSITQKFLREGKMVGLLGGDHSIPLGYIRALSEQYKRFGVLQIDAHADLRKAYQGFTYSHASIMYNVLKIPAVHRLVQVGVRDYCEEEMQVIKKSKSRIVTFFDEDIKTAMYQGKSWDATCDEIIEVLPDLVYISFDIDGMDPKLCPNTGTPVAGGFDFYQIVHLIKKVVSANKTIIGFDLNEVAPSPHHDWDANVGARMLYQLCNWMAVSVENKKKAAQSRD